MQQIKYIIISGIVDWVKFVNRVNSDTIRNGVLFESNLFHSENKPAHINLLEMLQSTKQTLP